MTYSVRREDFASIENEWESILPSCSADTIFVTPLWQKIWWQNFKNGSDLQLLSVRNGEELLGIAPLMLKDGIMSFIGDKDLFDYQDFLVRAGREEIFFKVLCEYLRDLDWEALRLTSLPEDSMTLKYLPALTEGGNASTELFEDDTTPVASLPSSWDEYLSGLGKKQRHELRRKLRRLETADNPHQYICDDPDTLKCCMDDFFRLFKTSGADKKEFLTPKRQKFFLDIASALSPRKQFKLYFLEVGGVRVASCICFDYSDSYLLYNSGYDLSYSHLSVGLLNKAFCIREAIEEGKRSFNFLRGTERYKYNLGGRDKTVYELIISRQG